MIEVVAAFLQKGAQFLICQRPEGKARANLWEFVGGKVERNETKEQALVRECKEELGISVSVGKMMHEVTYRYPDAEVHISFFQASIISGEPSSLEKQKFLWISSSEIDKYDFCPADREFLELINDRF